MKYSLVLSSLLCTLALSSLASAQSIADWETAANGLGAGFIAKDISAPAQMDIGTFDAGTNGGVTYEFIFNADVGGASSAFIGSLNAPAGDSAGLKFDQWNQTGTYGATKFGVADYTATTAHTTNALTHAVFVADGTDMGLYINGVFAETMADASFALSGLTGIGHAYNHNNDGSVDPLNGTIYATAIYDSALAASDISANYAALPEPGASALSLFAAAGLLVIARRRRNA